MTMTNLPWVERLFFRLQVRYGSAWNQMWEGIDPNAVKADWEECLAGIFRSNPNAISYALQNLPDRPPTSDQFLRLCRQARWPELAALPEPVVPVDSQRVKDAIEKMLKTRAELSLAGASRGIRTCT